MGRRHWRFLPIFKSNVRKGGRTIMLREQVLRCLKERVLNVGRNGPLFPSVSEHRNWLWGDGKSSPGFIDNPAKALSVDLKFGEGREHSGVVLDEVEQASLTDRVSRMLFGPPSAMNGSEPEMGSNIALVCPDPYDPKCWY